MTAKDATKTREGREKYDGNGAQEPSFQEGFCRVACVKSVWRQDSDILIPDFVLPFLYHDNQCHTRN